MSVLNQLKIRTRILILTLLPILVVAGLAVQGYLQASAKNEALQQLSIAMELARKTGGLLQQVQSERDYTYGFVQGKSNPALGERYRQQLREQRQRVDRALNDYKQYFAASKQQLGHFEQRVNSLLEGAAKLPRTRQHIDRYQLQYDDKKWVMNDYYPLVKRSLNIVNGVIKLAAIDSDLSLLLGSYRALIKLDTIVSFERGAMIRTLSQPTLDYVSVATTVAALRQSEDAAEGFRSYAPEDVGLLFRDTYMRTDIHKQLEKLRAKLARSGGESYQLSPDQWFEMSSQNIRALRQVIEFTDQRIAKQMLTQLDDAQSKVNNSILLLLGSILLIGSVSYFIILSIIAPLKILVKELKQVAETKDVSRDVPVTGTDELAEVSRAFNTLQNSFNEALLGVRGETSNMEQLTDSVSQSMAENKRRATSQDEATNSVSVAVNEMSATIQEVATIAQDTASAVVSAHQSSVTSAQNANDSKDILERLIAELASTQDKAKQLNSETEVIGSVLEVIQGIAEQTNLLALNAAIEAARAGEQGRGFAVVADEVRTLASRTQESTEQIRTQIETLQAGSRATTNSMEQLQVQGAQAVDVVVNSLAAFDRLREQLDNINGMSTQIATAAEEQTVVASEINERIHLVKDDTHEMTVQTDATVQACGELSQSGKSLSDYVNTFKVRG
ncbi:hypothetical protein GCM10011369_17250 [Neiella marina]|uniref:Methyl-accepting chemotaxis protein n=1 Tax=Neiella marina TaxID=508461 RepID=A0A8J2U4V6_9GAMM|nr:methyl-accepting chemotaxis protein [Neiella marina]GGA75930.1 hypothetical protein GCM10011369_17250 [Neiella marina]